MKAPHDLPNSRNSRSRYPFIPSWHGKGFKAFYSATSGNCQGARGAALVKATCLVAHDG